MNNFHSPAESYLPRWLTPALAAACADHPVIVLTGARQVGKSTLLRHAAPFAHYRTLSLDDYDTLRQARDDPAGLWAGADHVVLDEVQRAPQLLLAVKRAVDEQSTRCRFVLSGSANLLLLSQVSESLAGRAVYFTLHPMTCGELTGAPPPAILPRLLAGEWPEEGEGWQMGGSKLQVGPHSLPQGEEEERPVTGDLSPDTLLLRGLMPPLLRLETSTAWVRWWEGYVTAYLERDLRQLTQIADLVDFRRLMELASLRTGQVVNQSELARDAGLSQPTAHRYLNILEAGYLLFRLPAYTAGRSERLVKAPKLYWADAALAAYLAGYYDLDALRNARELGAIWETFVLHHLRVLAELLTPRARLYYWRERTGAEVDVVIEHGRRVLAVEIKRTDRPGYGDTAGLRAFLAAHPAAVGGVLLHTGPEVRRLGDKIVALPWGLVAG